MKILRIIGENLEGFTDGKLDINFTATDRVAQNKSLFLIKKNIYTQNVIALVGINASGKTRTLSIVKYVLNILVNGYGLNYTKIVPFGIKNGSKFTVFFTLQNKIYKWFFELLNDSQRWKYGVETLQERSMNSVKNKSDVYNFPEITIDKNDKLIRKQLPDNIKEMMPDDSSITIKLKKGNKSMSISLMQSTNFNVMLPIGEIPTEIINVLDSSIEYIKCENQDNAINCELKFKHNDIIFKLRSLAEINNLLSSGTVKGNEVFFAAMVTLINGGYFIIDEIENHFHKELVKLLINLFKDNNTNPNGATLLFSTHYVEILDIIDRKDDIYITMKSNNNISIKKYSEYISRNDLKKSDLLLSGIVKGTAPQYENIKKFKELLWQNLQKS